MHILPQRVVHEAPASGERRIEARGGVMAHQPLQAGEQQILHRPAFRQHPVVVAALQQIAGVEADRRLKLGRGGRRRLVRAVPQRPWVCSPAAGSCV